jgi:hypothetical protein
MPQIGKVEEDGIAAKLIVSIDVGLENMKFRGTTKR